MALFDVTFSVLFFAVFAIVLVIILMNVVGGVKEWHRNNRSPVLDVEAAVVSKRQDFSTHIHDTGDGAMHHTTQTCYYVTFQFHSNDRLELSVSGQQYGLLSEGDVGTLTFQGSRFLGFRRHPAC
ncbi:MAG: DUF2500 domain-containing protein [Clostridiales bacterium]|nr:DUF2500 domain-containing protein [Clostridiales bacterium]